MFAVRGIAVSISVFTIVYSTLSLAVATVWRRARRGREKYSNRFMADFLFFIRMSPLLAAILTTIAFILPSFLLFEPRSIQEPIGPVLFTLSLLGTVLALVGVVNAGVALRRSWRAISIWTRAAQTITALAHTPVLRISGSAPAVMATGIVHRRVVLSDRAQSVLNASELRLALRHELAHLRRNDNLKKLLMRLVAFPGMRALETAWSQATELAADDAAVSGPDEALDLAAALIKLSRFTMPPADLSAALIHSPASAMTTRVERLIAWDEIHTPAPRYSLRFVLAGISATATVLIVTYSHLLVQAHAITEWLVR
jgi:Zn-dependent protease with chaperone function